MIVTPAAERLIRTVLASACAVAIACHASKPIVTAANEAPRAIALDAPAAKPLLGSDAPALAVSAPPGFADKHSIASGQRYSCAVTSDHGVACWGDATVGPLQAASVVRIAGLDNVVGVNVGMKEGYAWRADGKALHWSPHGNIAAPQVVATLADVVDIEVDSVAACALRSNGTVACTMPRVDGVTDQPLTTFVDVLGLNGVAEIVVANNQACARAASGAVSCWDISNPASLHEVRAAANAVSLAGASVRTLGGRRSERFAAVLADGTLQGWRSDATQWRLPKLAIGATRLALGTERACALTADGAYCWNFENDLSVESAPSLLATQGAIRDIDLGAGVGCVRNDAGVVWCWGDVELLGDGRAREQAEPTPVLQLADAAELIATDDITCARRTSGTVACWRDAAPVDIAGVAGVTALTTMTSRKTATISPSVCALGARGMCWSVDWQGQPWPPRAIARHVARAAPPSSWNGSEHRNTWFCQRVGKLVDCSHSFFDRPDNTEEDVPEPALSAAINKVGPVRSLLFQDWTLYVISNDDRLTAISLQGNATVPLASDAVTVLPGPTRDGMQQEDCMLRRSGSVECWQRDDLSGRHTMAGLVDATALVGGDYHLCALRKTGAVMCWGNRDYLGTGDGNYVSVPVRVGP